MFHHSPSATYSTLISLSQTQQELSSRGRAQVSLGVRQHVALPTREQIPNTRKGLWGQAWYNGYTTNGIRVAPILPTAWATPEPSPLTSVGKDSGVNGINTCTDSLMKNLAKKRYPEESQLIMMKQKIELRRKLRARVHLRPKQGVSIKNQFNTKTGIQPKVIQRYLTRPSSLPQRIIGTMKNSPNRMKLLKNQMRLRRMVTDLWWDKRRLHDPSDCFRNSPLLIDLNYYSSQRERRAVFPFSLMIQSMTLKAYLQFCWARRYRQDSFIVKQLIRSEKRQGTVLIRMKRLIEPIDR